MIRSIRVYITERCNAKCPNCFNRYQRSDQLMSIDKFTKLCDFFSTNGIQSIKVMGGEPTTHPLFTEMMLVAQKYFNRVGLFTNGINEKIKSYSPRENDNITYNFKFSKLLTAEKLLLDKEGGRLLEVQIGKNVLVEPLIDEITRIALLSKGRAVVTLTLDCTENIFQYRESILNKYDTILKYLLKNRIPFRKDHKVPLCFIYGSDFPMTKKGSICNLECAGLIDARGYLRYCNQFSEILVNVFDKEGDLIAPEILYNYLKMKNHEIQFENLNKICSECIFYGVSCNGGCFVAKENILREDILKNTGLPILETN